MVSFLALAYLWSECVGVPLQASRDSLLPLLFMFQVVKAVVAVAAVAELAICKAVAVQLEALRFGAVAGLPRPGVVLSRRPVDLCLVDVQGVRRLLVGSGLGRHAGRGGGGGRNGHEPALGPHRGGTQQAGRGLQQHPRGPRPSPGRRHARHPACHPRLGRLLELCHVLGGHHHEGVLDGGAPRGEEGAGRQAAQLGRAQGGSRPHRPHRGHRRGRDQHPLGRRARPGGGLRLRGSGRCNGNRQPQVCI
uniref:Putative secreted protein n=1 Tax=Ixodes ricinus TaxID=34613 RepID=A0A147BCK3_IXORI